ncbi:Hypothetical protein A7982_04265 [Minicystis rosea]|nr:Hypothetical protein A7982_04265 [Minicystis rosea]
MDVSGMLRLRSPLLLSLAASAAVLGACSKGPDGPGVDGDTTGTTSSSTGVTGGAASTSSSTGGAGGAVTTSSTGGAPPECAGAAMVTASDGSDSGFARCPDGSIHRNYPVTCDAGLGVEACDGTEKSTACTTDAECVAHPHGRCGRNRRIDFSGVIIACECVYPCETDDECGAGQVCVCAGVVPADHHHSLCAPTTCKTGQDCASGVCGLSSLRLHANQCFADIELACHAPTDICQSNTDCADPSTECLLALGPVWGCYGPQCP